MSVERLELAAHQKDFVPSSCLSIIFPGCNSDAIEETYNPVESGHSSFRSSIPSPPCIA
jgi:hypothetical protein